MARAERIQTVQCAWQSQADFEMCTRDVGVAVSDRGVGLSQTVMIQDELGRTHINNTQSLSDQVWARKDFVLDAADVTDGTLYFYDRAQRSDGRRKSTASGTTRIEANGHRLQPIRHLPSTGWRMVKVPAQVLESGLNSFVFSGCGELLVEDSRAPNRSACSIDGGRTWDYAAMGPQGMNDGEYLVRLRLNRYPREALVTSPVLDLAALAADEGILPHVKGTRVRLQAEADRPQGTVVRLEVRISADGSDWTPWQPASKALESESLSRHLQWRVVLGSKSGQVSPVLKTVQLKAQVRLSGAERPSSIEVIETTPVNPVRSSYRFAFEEPHPRLERLRKQYDLQKVISGHRRELDRLVALRNWCRHSAPKGWDDGRTQWCPPWDALVILETNKQPLALCMCTHYSTLFVQTAAALGYVARQVIIDHHCVAEVWCNELRKWVLMDTGNAPEPDYNCHFEHDGVALNALELRRLWKQGRIEEVWAVYPSRQAVRLPEVDQPQRSCADMKLYRRFGMVMRNNHLLTPFPGELTQGRGEYFCDAYLWWEDGPVPVESPEYGLTTNREGDLYWPVNETAIELQSGTAGATLSVRLHTHTPNFGKFMVKLDGGKWREQSPQFTWKLKPGRNVLQARNVNSFGVSGPVSRALVELL